MDVTRFFIYSELNETIYSGCTSRITSNKQAGTSYTTLRLKTPSTSTKPDYLTLANAELSGTFGRFNS